MNMLSDDNEDNSNNEPNIDDDDSDDDDLNLRFNLNQENIPPNGFSLIHNNNNNNKQRKQQRRSMFPAMRTRTTPLSLNHNNKCYLLTCTH